MVAFFYDQILIFSIFSVYFICKKSRNEKIEQRV